MPHPLSKLSLVIALLSSASLLACAEGGTTGTDGGGGRDAGPRSDAGGDGDAGTTGSDSGMLEGAFTGCALNEAPAFGACADPNQLDFGVSAVGAATMRLARLRNDTEATVTVTGVDVASADFSAEAVAYTGGAPRTPVTLPASVEPGGQLWFEVTLTASAAGPVPADRITFLAGAMNAVIPIVGSVSGCEGADTADCDGDPSNGCETNTSSDQMNCGACGTVCSSPGEEMTCTAGRCVGTGCATGFGDCDPGVDGCETNIQGDANNCGGCGRACVATNGTNTCMAGRCSPTCERGAGDCDGNPSNGCERLDSLENCGACGVRCEIPGAMVSCASGSCEAIGCAEAGTANCDGNFGNGCERLDTLENCGACGSRCDLPAATETCSSGTCRGTGCEGGAGNCDGNLDDGCEPLNTTSDCGGCGVRCSSNNASSASCVGGSCRFTCASNYADCDLSGGNGCETATNTNSNCGGCGTRCNLSNAVESCSTGSCRVSSCTGSYANCDGNHSNGCERNLDPSSNCTVLDTDTTIPSVSGDTGGVGWEHSRSGVWEQVFRVRVTEDSTSSENLQLAVHLQNHGSNDYSLQLGMDECGEVGCWRRRNDTGVGGNEYHSIEWNDRFGSNDDRWVYIWVRHVSGNDCNGFTIQIDGDALYTSRHWTC